MHFFVLKMWIHFRYSNKMYYILNVSEISTLKEIFGIATDGK